MLYEGTFIVLYEGTFVKMLFERTFIKTRMPYEATFINMLYEGIFTKMQA